MPRCPHKPAMTLAQRFPPSPPCCCPICLAYCARPGWWTVEEAARAIQAGYARRMMLEIAPEYTFGVLSPAFKGNEGRFALNAFKDHGCTFLRRDRCQLHGTPYMPLECRFCHHDRPGQGQICHDEIEHDWDTPEGQTLVDRWSRIIGFTKELRDFQKSMKANKRR